eukprot:79876-Rhodomonas_salina.3
MLPRKACARTASVTSNTASRSTHCTLTGYELAPTATVRASVPLDSTLRTILTWYWLAHDSLAGAATAPTPASTSRLGPDASYSQAAQPSASDAGSLCTVASALGSTAPMLASTPARSERYARWRRCLLYTSDAADDM